LIELTPEINRKLTRKTILFCKVNQERGVLIVDVAPNAARGITSHDIITEVKGVRTKTLIKSKSK